MFIWKFWIDIFSYISHSYKAFLIFATSLSAFTFKGPSLIAFSSDHPGAAARLFTDFAKANENFELKAAAFEGNAVDVNMLAKLPTYDEAISRLMSVINFIKKYYPV